MDTKSNARIHGQQHWTQMPDKCVHGLPEFEQANTLRETTVAALKKSGQANNYQVKVRKYPLKAQLNVKSTFSVLVFKRIKNDRINVSHGVTGSDSYTIYMSKNNELVTPPVADKETKFARSKKEQRAERRANKKRKAKARSLLS